MYSRKINSPRISFLHVLVLCRGVIVAAGVRATSIIEISALHKKPPFGNPRGIAAIVSQHRTKPRHFDPSGQLTSDCSLLAAGIPFE